MNAEQYIKQANWAVGLNEGTETINEAVKTPLEVNLIAIEKFVSKLRTQFTLVTTKLKKKPDDEDLNDELAEIFNTVERLKDVIDGE